MNSSPSGMDLLLDETDSGLRVALQDVDSRRYAIRNLIPAGYEPYFQEQARFTNAHTSTAIEGNPLREEDAFRVLVEGADPDRPAEVEKANLDEAYQLVELLAPDKSLRIDEGLVRAFNSVALKSLPGARNWGRYRLGQNIIVDSATREVRYVPPPAESVPLLMAAYVQRVEEWRNRYPGPIAAALGHFGLVSIHPFDDGNGRTARLVADLLLHQTGWSVDGMLSINPLLLERRTGYYDALWETQGERYAEELDVTPFVVFHTEQLAAAATRLEERALAFGRQLERWTTEFPFLNARQVTALMSMLDVGQLSSSRYATLTGSSQATAIADLGEMLKAGVITREGAGPSTRYRLAPAMKA